MGRLIEIDEDKLKDLLNNNKIELTNNIISVVRENYIPKADYEEQIKINNKLVKDNKQLKAYITMMQVDYNLRLKAEKVAMLTDLQAEIEECEDCGRAFHLGLWMASKTIQKKIDKLEENTDGTISN